VFTLGNVTRYAKYDRLVASSVTPSPDTCCDKPSGTVSTACSRPNTAPAKAAASTPTYSGAPRYTTSQPVKAPAAMMPSMPRFKTPARSHSSTPKVPRISGVARRSTATQKAEELNRSIHSMACSSSPVAAQAVLRK
jgi:hypothetical protein